MSELSILANRGVAQRMIRALSSKRTVNEALSCKNGYLASE